MHNATILLVEDNDSLRTGMAIFLRANGYEVLLADNAISAAGSLVMEKPDLMILDLELPHGNGFDVLEGLRTRDCIAQTAVIVLTGCEVAGNRDRALRTGVAAFFQKPIEGAALLLAIRSSLDKLPGKLRSAE
jgi:DNA-binding response OmpR family regulator